LSFLLTIVGLLSRRLTPLLSAFLAAVGQQKNPLGTWDPERRHTVFIIGRSHPVDNRDKGRNRKTGSALRPSKQPDTKQVASAEEASAFTHPHQPLHTRDFSITHSRRSCRNPTTRLLLHARSLASVTLPSVWDAVTIYSILRIYLTRATKPGPEVAFNLTALPRHID